jgi:hypothetical protein
VKWVLACTLLALAVVVGLAVATWLTIPSGHYESKNLTAGRWETGRLTYPARLFNSGLVERYVAGCDPATNSGSICDQPYTVYRQVNLHTVRQRVVVFFGGLALVLILVGLAVGLLRRKPAAPQATSPLATPWVPPPTSPPPPAPPPQGEPPPDWPASV